MTLSIYNLKKKFFFTTFHLENLIASAPHAKKRCMFMFLKLKKQLCNVCMLGAGKQSAEV